eukprot:CAMPEP_0184860190 /NCGR_PEP_ID=MMETSP0580-20130426/5136_1 /TAXON_ID=1118495 /ORGANISM="Dactyliosolen fragilissimus" /LENGTH=927 /DNA_ID=CAMNT_0027357217 /DNA_START=110 /DNA_END=2893 /DNA_ORIENTATION=+
MTCNILLVIFLAYFTGAQDDSDGKIIVLSDLSRHMSLGELFDARRDLVVPGKLWDQSFIEEYTYETDATFSNIDLSLSDNLRDRLEKLDIGVEAAFDYTKSSLSISVDGSFKYLSNKKTTNNSVRYSVIFKTRTKRTSLDVFNGNMLANTNRHFFSKQDECDASDCNLATHVVSSITWGANVVASYENTYNTIEDKNVIEAYLKGALTLKNDSIKASVDGTLITEELIDELDNKTTVQIFGDVKMTEKIPTKPSEALDFIERLPTLTDTAVGIGVPMEITLTPLVWIDSNAAKLTRQIGNDRIEKALEIYEALEESEARINDLIALRYDGFTKWKFDTDEYYREFREYQSDLSFSISNAAESFLSENGGIEDLVKIEEDYFNENNRFNFLSVFAECEMREDVIKTLLALASQFQPAKITFGEHLSDFFAPTFDIRYDIVYGLVVVGSNDTFKNREGINYVRDFVELANAHICYDDDIDESKNEKPKYCPDKNGEYINDSEIKHCKPIVNENVVTCTNKEAYVAIHFDSFCSSLCDIKYCKFESDGNSEDLTLNVPYDPNPFDDEWCSKPSTQLIRFVNNRPPLPSNDDFPRAPDPVSLSFDSESDDLEVVGKNQHIELHVTNINRETRLLKFIIAYYEPDHDGDKLDGYETKEIEMAYYVRPSEKEEKFVKIGGLSAGQVYDISVIPKNDIGEGETTILPDVKIGDATADITIKIDVGNNETFEIEAHEFFLKSPLFPLWNDLDIELKLSIKSATKVAYVTLHKTIKNRNKATAYLSESDGVIKCNVVEGSFTSATCQIRDIDLEELDSNNIIDLNNNTILTLSIWDDYQQLIADKEVTIPKATKYRCKEFGGKKFCPKSPDLNVDGYKDFDRCVDDCGSCDVRTDFLKHVCVPVVPSSSPSDNPSLSPSDNPSLSPSDNPSLRPSV